MSAFRPLFQLVRLVRLVRPAAAPALLLCAAVGARADALPPPLDQAYPGTIVLKVDATNTAQQIFRIRESIPAKAGKLTLLYPQWVPGNHGPSGPLNQFAGLKLSANGKPLEWRRDTVNVHAFHLEVPSGASSVEAEYQYLSPVEPNQGRTTITNDILGVQWHAMALYPAGYRTRRITVQPNLTLPAGWQYGSALETAARVGDQVAFKPLDLETLVDSPLFAGRHFKRIDLDPGAPIAVHLNVVADSAEALDAKPEQIEAHRAMVQQAYKLFKSQHYAHYDFLLALSDEFGGIGREHHQSSENGVKPGYFTDWAKSEGGRELLPHEFTHSWNGKFRRPADQDVADFNTPLQNSLLWVYEGQTQYWGYVLSARSGLIKAANVRDVFAASAARYDAVRGRAWRAVQDTTNDPIINGRRPQGWNSWQRSEDYYTEGALIWLDVDTRIRQLSGERRSLNDFAAAFFGVADGSAVARHYSFDEVVEALAAVQPYDWAGFLRDKLDGHGPGAPLDGLARAGWKLVYTDKPTDFLKGLEEQSKSASFQYSLGFSVGHEGRIEAVQWDGVGFRAGLSGNTTLLAVNGRAYKAEQLRAAITAAKGGGRPIELLVKKGSLYRTVALDYHDGLKYPRLERIEGTTDRLEAILQPLK
ncbi:M61 family metallopeptidase [Rugamonas sp. CCM 8940]|uniref:M61 family metallopeptidase n=1 Tax=Rugamonas sp. CCM 8940 TaxID=2765359 RepID=UPI0018F3B447|nr:M61 family metallopeptidase [Rugamonas sp. CCM 8940]MBJ7311062.1 M61 family metallopeptidase [Rugamonas sp. CCM 8940]